MTETFYPGLNRILVKEKEVPSNPKSVLFSTESNFKYGEIVAKGAIKDSKEIGEDYLKVGDDVYFLANAGLDISLPHGTFKLLAITEILVGKKGE